MSLRPWRTALFLLVGNPVLGLSTVQAQYVVIFDENDSRGREYRSASYGFSEGGDFLELSGPESNKLPVEYDAAYSGDTSGRLSYRHHSGRWEMFVASPGWVGRNLSDLDSLILYLNGPDSISAADLPRIGLEDTDNDKSGLVPMADYAPALDGDTTTWQRASIPLGAFPTEGGFDIAITKTVRFTDGAQNDTVHTIWFDLIVAVADGPQTPTTGASDVQTRNGDRSVIIRWDPAENAIGHHVYRSVGKGPAVRITSALVSDHFVDFIVSNGVEYTYTVLGFGPSGQEGPLSTPVSATPRDLTDDEFLDLVARTAFDYFWYEANPNNGLVKDRSTSTSNSSIAAVGFGLTAIPIAVDRGWLDRNTALERVLTTLEFFWNSPHSSEPDATGYRGFYYHFLNMESGRRAGTTELSTIDTALLLGGVIFAREYFDGSDEREERIRSLADSIYQRVEWDWASPRPPRVSHGWRPESGFIQYDWGGYNEAMILYVLALGSPTHPVTESAWNAWTSGYRWETHFGVAFVRFPPLFGHQYSHAWIDFRGIQDAYMKNRGIDYFENSRRATMANRNYCIANPGGWEGYGPNVWGLTASDGPSGYRARGAPPAQNDDGTITPTAAGGSIVFTPELSTTALRTFYENYRTQLWGQYGFRDAFNLTANWFGTDYLGIDQGPILLMIENLRSEGVWSRFMRNGDIQRGLDRAGFEQVGTAVDPEIEFPSDKFTATVYPNPFNGSTQLELDLGRSRKVDLRVFDSIGRQVARPVEGTMASGRHRVQIDASDWAIGVYHYVLMVDGAARYGQLIHLK